MGSASSMTVRFSSRCRRGRHVDTIDQPEPKRRTEIVHRSPVQVDDAAKPERPDVVNLGDDAIAVALDQRKDGFEVRAIGHAANRSRRLVWIAAVQPLMTYSSPDAVSMPPVVVSVGSRRFTSMQYRQGSEAPEERPLRQAHPPPPVA
jgi:hypothetical protein